MSQQVALRTRKPSTVRTTTAPNARAKAQEAVKRFQSAQEAVREFAEDNHELFDTFMSLAGDYNAALGEAKHFLRELKTSQPIAMGPFHRAKDTAPTIGYKPGLLPNEYLLVPGVIKEVDAKRIAALVKSGDFDKKTVAKAATESPGRSPSIRGPKEIAVEL